LLLFPLFWEAEVALAATVSEVVGPGLSDAEAVEGGL
jgi:hypothetical protein